MRQRNGQFRLITSWVAIGAALLLYACGAAPAGLDDPAAGPAAQTVALEDVLADVRSYQPPAGVEGFEELRQGLIDALESQGGDRIALVAPGGPGNVADDVTVNNVNGSLSWTYRNTGDYDQNGEVNAADLTPIAIFFGATPASDNWTDAQVADGDRNEEVNAADIQPIAVNYLNTVASYNIYTSNTLDDYPADPDGVNGAGAVMAGTISFELADTPPGFKVFTAQIDTPVDQNYYWVRPSDGIQLGARSNNVQYDQPIDPNDPPTAVLDATVLTGEAPLQVDFDASGSFDTDGTLVKFEWDFDGAAGGFVWEDTDIVDTNSHTYAAAGTYDAVVRVTDNQGATDTATLQIEVTEPVITGFKVGGLVRNSQHLPPQPIPEVTVHLIGTSVGNDFSADAVTDATGQYEFTNVPGDAKYGIYCDDPDWLWSATEGNPIPVPLGDSDLLLTEDSLNNNIASNGPAT